MCEAVEFERVEPLSDAETLKWLQNNQFSLERVNDMTTPVTTRDSRRFAIRAKTGECSLNEMVARICKCMESRECGSS